jgi:hypothetical protein
MALEKALISAGIDILSSTVGLVAGKVYDHLTNKLKDGDLASEQLRQIIVRDLNDIRAIYIRAKISRILNKPRLK